MSDSLGAAVAIVGVGALFPGAGDAHTLWDNVVSGFDAISDVPPTRLDAEYFHPDAPAASDRLYCRRGGFVDADAVFDPAAFGIMPMAAAAAEPDQLLALRVASEAIADAGGTERLGDPARVGVILGRGGYLSPAGARLESRVRTAHQLVVTLRELVPGLRDEQLADVRAAFQAQLGPERPEAAIGLVPNLVASRIANRLDLQGPAYTVDAACASSLVAVDQAVAALSSGRCDAVLAGGTHHTHDIMLWSVFTQLGALSRRQVIRPFDRGADGMLIGEGTGMVVLKRLADAERSGDRIYAVVRGCGVSSDGRASTLMAPRSAGQVLAVERAWRAAGLDPTAPGALGLLEAHGTGTPAGDEAELESLRTVFGPGAGEIGIGSIKSMIGHAMPAAGIAGLIKAALSVHHSVLPPTLHCAEPLAAFGGSRFAPVTTARDWPESAAPRRAAVDAFGFGGINAHVVLEQAPSVAAIVPPVRTERVLLIAGADPTAVARELELDDATLLAREHDTDPGAPCRLAVVGPTPQRIALARRIVARGSAWHGRNDIWFRPAPLVTDSRGVAFLYPGLEPDQFADISGVAGHFGLSAPSRRDSDDFVEQAVDVIGASRVLTAVLDEIGVEADLLAGHSMGEWTAMIVGGIFDRAATDELIESLGPGSEIPDLLYAALGCSAADAAEVVADVDGVVVSHDNCPHQTVICGPSEGVETALEHLRARGILGQIMPVRTGFHTPMLAPYLAPVHETLRRLPLHPAERPVWSATALEEFPADPATVRDLVVRHLVEPVAFRQLVERLYERGSRVFVQVGAGSLPGFVDDTLRGRDQLTVPLAAAGRDGLATMRRAVAALWVAGLSPRVDRIPGIPRRSATTIRLALGNPLIRMGESAAPLTIAVDRPAPVAADPILAEFDALVAAAALDARVVVDAWQTGRRPRPVGTAPPIPAESIRTHTYSLATMPELTDHSLRPIPAHWPDLSDGFPVVPLTVMLESMADVARELCPGRVVIGFAEVRALRWLVVAPPTTAVTKAVRRPRASDGIDRVDVTIEGHSSGTVLLAEEYPAAPRASSEELIGRRSPVVRLPELYADRWLFHGPKFAGIRDVTCNADNGLAGVIETLPTKGALLDCAGQLIGHWSHVNLDVDKLVLPTGFRAIEFYGPYPAVGQRSTETVWIREKTATEVRADAELVDAGGRVWARIIDWRVRRFACAESDWPMILRPESAGIGRVQPGGWCLVRERWPDTASRELWMRSYLTAAERQSYDSLNPMLQRHWLLGRMAAKDAVREWLWANGSGDVHPCEVRIDDAADGIAATGAPVPPGLNVAAAHTTSRGRALGFGVAIAGHGPTAIALEPVATDDPDAEARARAIAVAHVRRLSGADGAIESSVLTESESTHIVAWTTQQKGEAR